MDRRDLRLRPTLALLLVFGAGCAPGPAEGPGHRAQRLGLSPQDEYQLGVRAYAEVLNEAREKNTLVTHGPAVQRVADVGQRIATVAAGDSRMSRLLRREINIHIEGYRFDWEFNVINSNQVNAFCLPGGKVVVFTGLLALVDREGRGRDDWLATVLGHEIAHALAHHASERLARESLTERAGQVVASGIGTISPEERDRLLKVLAVGGRFGSLPFDRRQESEADHIGVFLMAFAGYDPHAAVGFWEVMAEHGSNVPEILSDHPSDARRIAELRVWADKAAAAKQAFDSGNTVDAAR
jgi:metalloendopeptidase OMA1, mitochondrial